VLTALNRQRRFYSYVQVSPRDELDGHRAMLVGVGVSFPADEVTCNLEID
jgi:hypothetical protein